MLLRLPAEEPAVRRYVETLWLPYHRELEAVVDGHALADDVDVVEAETGFRLDWLESDGNRLWVAFDGDGRADGDGASGGEASADDGNGREDGEASADDAADAAGAFAATAGTAVGFVTTRESDTPSVFDGPDRLVLGDIYVREAYRGTGLAEELVERAAEDARERGRSELALDVDADNERALAFYESLGFETSRRRMTVPVEGL